MGSSPFEGETFSVLENYQVSSQKVGRSTQMPAPSSKVKVGWPQICGCDYQQQSMSKLTKNAT